MSLRLLSYTQHLEGLGHLVRSLRITAGIKQAGLDVDLVMGGVPVKDLETHGLHVVKLPSLRAGPGGFSDLRDSRGKPATEAYKDKRRDQLLGLLETLSPDAIMIEAFPFGRRQMRFELIPFLEAARNRQPRPLIICSVRDILQENKSPDRVEDTISYLRTYFDLVLVHGDPNFADLALTFPRADEISDLVHYTGIVAGSPPSPAQTDKAYKVVVSTGGGATGENILKCALKARPKTSFANDLWCVVTGPYLSENVFDQLKSEATDGLELHAFRNDLASVMAQAEVSVSRCGYNTVVDIFQTKARAVIIPNANDGETEQTRRAQLLADRQLAIMLDESQLDPDRLAAAIDRAADMPAPTSVPNLKGVETTARLVSEALSARFSP
jgi:predicted glycosyltransferase